MCFTTGLWRIKVVCVCVCGCAGLSEDADIGDAVGVFKATSLHTPSDIVYYLEYPVTVTRNDNSLQSVPDDMFRLESTSDGAVVYVNQLNSTYSLHDANRFSYRVVAVDTTRLDQCYSHRPSRRNSCLF